jgi:Glutathione S-transferase
MEAANIRRSFVQSIRWRAYPSLELSGGEVLTQSLAIIEYLDEIHPEPPLLPPAAFGRARARAIAQMIACDIHPLNNLIALQYLRRQLKHEQPDIDAWYHHWITQGFTAMEEMLDPAPYACGQHVTVADICLVPQVANARRLKVPLEKFPKIVAVEAACLNCLLSTKRGPKSAGRRMTLKRLPPTPQIPTAPFHH